MPGPLFYVGAFGHSLDIHDVVRVMHELEYKMTEGLYFKEVDGRLPAFISVDSHNFTADRAIMSPEAIPGWHLAAAYFFRVDHATAEVRYGPVHPAWPDEPHPIEALLPGYMYDVLINVPDGLSAVKRAVAKRQLRSAEELYSRICKEKPVDYATLAVESSIWPPRAMGKATPGYYDNMYVSGEFDFPKSRLISKSEGGLQFRADPNDEIETESARLQLCRFISKKFKYA